MADLSTKLRRETSMNFSGKLRKLSNIEHLKEANYYVKEISLDGDAPKQFIQAYFYEAGGKVHKRNPRTWIPFIAKTAEKWYPNESVVEYMVNCIGIELGINMNAVRLVPNLCEINPLNTQANPPIPIIRKDSIGILNSAPGCSMLYLFSMIGTKTQNAYSSHI